MKWIKLDITNLPEGEILAANFKKGSKEHNRKIVGFLHKRNDYIICENGRNLVEHCTHYIDINKIQL